MAIVDASKVFVVQDQHRNKNVVCQEKISDAFGTIYRNLHVFFDGYGIQL